MRYLPRLAPRAKYPCTQGSHLVIDRLALVCAPLEATHLGGCSRGACGVRNSLEGGLEESSVLVSFRFFYLSFIRVHLIGSMFRFMFLAYFEFLCFE